MVAFLCLLASALSVFATVNAFVTAQALTRLSKRMDVLEHRARYSGEAE